MRRVDQERSSDFPICSNMDLMVRCSCKECARAWWTSGTAAVVVQERGTLCVLERYPKANHLMVSRVDKYSRGVYKLLVGYVGHDTVVNGWRSSDRLIID